VNRDPRERWLLAATIASGLGVALSHAGGTAGCATAKVSYGSVHAPLAAGQDTTLSLFNVNSSTNEDTRASIGRGARLEVEWDSRVGRAVSERLLVGIDSAKRTLLVITEDAKNVDEVDEIPIDTIRRITVIGGTRTGAGAGYGALIGGLTGAAIGAVAAASTDAGQAKCGAGVIVTFGGGVVGASLGGGAGAATGAGVGASMGRLRTDYPIGPDQWVIGMPPPPPRAAVQDDPYGGDASRSDSTDGGP
jgi:hypothetical protein